MRKPFIFILMAMLLAAGGCSGTVNYDYLHSYQACPIKVQPSVGYNRQVDYTLNGRYITSYSHITVCFRRLDSNGLARSYNEITDSRSDPNTYRTYHTYKQLNYDETGVVVRWVELTDKDSGNTERYTNY